MGEHRRPYPTECMSSRRPPYRTEAPIFYRCSICGGVHVCFRPVGIQPEGLDEAGCCCGHPLTRLIPQELEPDSEHTMKFCIFGGFSHNAVRVEVGDGRHPMTEGHHIEWIFLHSFQGGQMKYLPLRGESAALFAMANEDAFVFCDRDVCRMGWEHCLFQCKRGHTAYAYCSRDGLYHLKF